MYIDTYLYAYMLCMYIHVYVYAYIHIYIYIYVCVLFDSRGRPYKSSTRRRFGDVIKLTTQYRDRV